MSGKILLNKIYSSHINHRFNGKIELIFDLASHSAARMGVFRICSSPWKQDIAPSKPSLSPKETSFNVPVLPPLHQNLPGLLPPQVPSQVINQDQEELEAEKEDEEVKEKEGGLSVIRDRFYLNEDFDE